jgi:hypothetical protein
MDGMTDTEFEIAVRVGLQRSDAIQFVVVYESPKDYPGQYVARAHFVGQGLRWASADTFIVRDSIAGIRRLIAPLGMCRINRDIKDDAVIVESWI